MLIVNLVLFIFVIVLADNAFKDYNITKDIFAIKLLFLNKDI